LVGQESTHGKVEYQTRLDHRQKKSTVKNKKKQKMLKRNQPACRATLKSLSSKLSYSYGTKRPVHNWLTRRETPNKSTVAKVEVPQRTTWKSVQ